MVYSISRIVIRHTVAQGPSFRLSPQKSGLPPFSGQKNCIIAEKWHFLDRRVCLVEFS